MSKDVEVTPPEESVYDAVVELLNQARLTVHRSATAVGRLHADTAITVPMRAVLEFLRREGPTTVAGIARARSVSRQHIQQIVNDLADDRLVERRDNPDHKRAPLIALTTAGAGRVDAMFEAEHRAFAGAFEAFGALEVQRATDVLRAVGEAMTHTMKEQS